MTSVAYLAFETGGTKLVAAVADVNSMLLESHVLVRKQDDRAPHSLVQLIEAAKTLRGEFESKGYAFRAIGFGYGGQVNRTTQRVLACPHEAGWEDVDVRDVLLREFNLPSVIENDCKLAALAEACLGAGRGYRAVFYVTIGTGIGGGIVRDGHIVDFGEAGEAELGHIVVTPEPDALPCGCGSKGCLEAMCSGLGMAVLAKKLAKDHPGDWKGNAVAQRAIHDKRFTAKDLFAAWDANDLFASVVLRVATHYLGYALGALVQIVNPDVIVFGGGVGSSSERFVARIEEATKPFVMPLLRGHCRFAISQRREQVVTQGAALLAAQRFQVSWGAS